MKKQTLLTATLALVTATLLASCGSSGGASGGATGSSGNYPSSSTLNQTTNSKPNNTNSNANQPTAPTSSEPEYKTSTAPANDSSIVMENSALVNANQVNTINSIYAADTKDSYYNLFRILPFFLEDGEEPEDGNNSSLDFENIDSLSTNSISYWENAYNNYIIGTYFPIIKEYKNYHKGFVRDVVHQNYRGIFDRSVNHKASNLPVSAILVDQSFNNQLISGQYGSQGDDNTKLFSNAYVASNTGLAWNNNSTNNHAFYTGYLMSGYVHPQENIRGFQFYSHGVANISTLGFVGVDGSNLANRTQSLNQLQTYLAKQQLDNQGNYATVVDIAVGEPTNNPFYYKSEQAGQSNLVQPGYDFLSKVVAPTNYSNKRQAPLFVLPTGNYNKATFFQKLLNYYKSLPTEEHYNFTQNVVNKTNFGLALTKNSALGRLAQDPTTNGNFIAVAGITFDNETEPTNVNHSLSNKKEGLNRLQLAGIYLYNIDVKLKSHFDVGDADAGVYNSHSLFNIPKVIDVGSDSLKYKGYVYSPIGGFQCGAVAYDCVSAPYNYTVPPLAGGKYQSLSGTEYAAAYVSGVALLVKQKFPWMSAKNLKTTLLTTATDVGAPGVDPVFGWGVVNALRAYLGPREFAFGDFDVDFKINYLNATSQQTTTIRPRDVVGLYTQNPLLDNIYFKNTLPNLNFYEFARVRGKGGLNLDDSNGGITSALTIFLPGYEGKTNIKNSVLVLQNNLYDRNYPYTTLTSDKTQHSKGVGIKDTHNWLDVYNLDQLYHPTDYAARAQDESKATESSNIEDLDSNKDLITAFTKSSQDVNNLNQQNAKLKQDLGLTDKDYTFSSAITIGNNGVLVSSLNSIDSVNNESGYFIPHAFYSFSNLGDIKYDATPLKDSPVVKHYTQGDKANLVIGVTAQDMTPYVDSPNNNGVLGSSYATVTCNGLPCVTAYYNKGRQFVRATTLKSTAFSSDSAKIAGNALIYFDYNPLTLPSTDNSSEHRDYTSYAYYGNTQLNFNNGNPYIPTSGIKVILIKATDLQGRFNQVKFFDSSLENKYQISSQTMVTVADTNNHLADALTVNITPITSTSRVNPASGHSVLDTNLVSRSVSSLDQLYTKADQQYFGSNNDQNYLALASAAQSTDNSNFRTFLYQNALTVYPDLQLAITQNTYTQVNNFIDRVANNYLHNVSQQVYFDYNYNQTNWTSPTSAIFGSNKGHNLSLGYYGQNYGLNYGLAGVVNYGTWNEDLTSLNADLSHLQLANLTNLASAKTLSAGLVASLGKAQANSFYALNFSANFHNYDLTRNLLFLTETAKFNALDFELAGRYGYNLYHSDNSRLTVIGGLSLVDNYRLAIKETASVNPTKLEQVTGNTDAQAVAEQFAYTSLDAKAHNSLNAYASVALDYTYNFKVLNFNQAVSIQGKAERVLNDLNFNVNSETNGSSLASTSVFNNNYIITAKATYQMNFTNSVKLDLYAGYTFCQSWNNKSAGTSLTYSF